MATKNIQNFVYEKTLQQLHKRALLKPLSRTPSCTAASVTLHAGAVAYQCKRITVRARVPFKTFDMGLGDFKHFALHGPAQHVNRNGGCIREIRLMNL